MTTWQEGEALGDKHRQHHNELDAQISGSQPHGRDHSITSTADHDFPGGTDVYLRGDGVFAEPGPGSAHPDLATHDAMGLATDAALAAHLATENADHGLEHSDLNSIGADDHHAQSHSHASHTGVGANDHHTQLHTVTDAAHHTFPGGTTSWLRADGTFTSVGAGQFANAPVLVASTDMPQAIKDVSDFVCDGVADQTEINNAINLAAPLQSRNANMPANATQRGTVQLTGGRFTLSAPILIRTAVHLQGVGRATEIRPGNSFSDAGAGSGTACFKMNTVNDHLWVLSDVYFEGNSATGANGRHAIHLNGTSADPSDYPASGNDPNIEIYGLFIRNFVGGASTRYGIYGNDNMRGSLIHDIEMREMRDNAIYWANSPDSHFDTIHVGSIGTVNGGAAAGFYIDGGNNKLTNCKSFYCPSGSTTPSANHWAFRLAGGRGSMAACEAQDSYQGVIFDGTPFSSMGLIVDNASNVGVMVSTNRVQAIGFQIFQRAGGRYGTMTTGLDSDATYTGINVTGSVDPSNITTPVANTIRFTSGARNFVRVDNGTALISAG